MTYIKSSLIHIKLRTFPNHNINKDVTSYQATTFETIQYEVNFVSLYNIICFCFSLLFFFSLLFVDYMFERGGLGTET